MEPLNVECDLQSLRRLYSLLLLQSNAHKEYVPQAFLLDENSQFLLKRLLDAATEEHLDRQHKVLAQAQLGLPERISTPSTTKVNSVSRGMVKLPSKIGLIHEVVDSIERIETQLSAFQFCSRRGDRTRSCKSPSGVTPTEEDDYSSSVMPFQRLMEPRQSCLKSRRMSRHTTRTSSVAPSLKSVNNTTARRSLYDPTLALQSQESSSRDDQIVLATSRPPLPPIPLRSVGFEKSRQSNRMSQKMRPTLLLDQGNETGTSSESEEQVYSTEQESEEASGETVSTSGSSWQTHAESVTGSDSSYPSESDDYEDDENSQVSDSPPHNRSKLPSKQRKKGTGRLKRFKDKLGKVFHHHHYHHHEHHNKEEDHGRKPSAWKHLVKKHLNKKDKEKLVEKQMKTESKGLTTHNKKGGEFHALVKGFMRHHRRHSKNKKQKFQTPKRQGGVKFPRGGRIKLEKTNYLCNNDQEHDEN